MSTFTHAKERRVEDAVAAVASSSAAAAERRALKASTGGFFSALRVTRMSTPSLTRNCRLASVRGNPLPASSPGMAQEKLKGFSESVEVEEELEAGMVEEADEGSEAGMVEEADAVGGNLVKHIVMMKTMIEMNGGFLTTIFSREQIIFQIQDCLRRTFDPRCL